MSSSIPHERARWITYWTPNEYDDHGMPKDFAAYHVVPVVDCPTKNTHTFMIGPWTAGAANYNGQKMFSGPLADAWKQFHDALDALHPGLEKRESF